MEEMVTITKKEYEELKRKAGEDLEDDTLAQAKRGLDDAKEGRLIEVAGSEDI